MEETIISGDWQGYLGRGLAPREIQFLLLVAQGLTAKEIAKDFGLAPSSVAKRLSSVMFKLGVHRQSAMVAEAMKRQIICPVCVVLAAVIAIHAMIDDQSSRPNRRVADRRIQHLSP
ncbi:response regulator transcription factor [Pseudomonas helleri]|uniref:response regulator transcription factor n=1 Tax=Pseudomonas helleri TaxID=1608996 RepID=UPI003F9CD8D5